VIDVERKRAYAIKREILDLILEVSKENFPNEFAGILRCENVVGTVHSHPSESNNPSGADLGLFRKFGYVHIITKVPYNPDSWRSWDLDGNPYPLEVID
jgi:proteasome lid subunit RPN8/RPN11